jgi:hypothetical protein
MTSSESFSSGHNNLEQSHNAAWVERRDKYISEAIDSVLKNKEKEILKGKYRPEIFVWLVTAELREKTGLFSQIPQSQRNNQDFNVEFDHRHVRELIYDFFNISKDENSDDALEDSIKKEAALEDALKKHYRGS